TSGHNKNLELWTVLWDTKSMGTYPGVLWAGLMIGTLLECTNLVVQVTVAIILVQTLYGFKLWEVGVFDFAGPIGAHLAVFFDGRLTDTISNRWVARNDALCLPKYHLSPLLI
ncbi:uncharacterized protein M421DRAFT_78955, partial [Didymella exigua CBS 183.55]